MKNTFAILFGLLLSVNMLYTQTDFRAGYVIKLDGDTLYGELDYRSNSSMSKVCTFRKSKGDTIKHYYPNDILAYRFNNSKYYISKELDGNKVFLEFLVNSRICFYYMADDFLADHYYFEKDSVPLIELPYAEIIKNDNNREYLYKTNKHNGILTYYLQEAKGLESEIKLIKKPDHKNLIALAQNYNKVVCEGEKCIVYEKKLPPFKIDFEICGGTVSLFDFDDLQKRNTTGIITHIWLPRISENLYFKTGLFGAKSEFQSEKTFVMIIPVQVEYIYPHGIIRPKLAFGLNAPFMSVNLSPGLNIKLFKSVYWSLNSDFGFVPNVSAFYNERFKVKLLTTSFTTGIYIKL